MVSDIWKGSNSSDMHTFWTQSILSHNGTWYNTDRLTTSVPRWTDLFVFSCKNCPLENFTWIYKWHFYYFTPQSNDDMSILLKGLKV